jgi:hypothetical protein
LQIYNLKKRRIHIVDIYTCACTAFYAISALWASILAPVQHSTPYLHYGHLYLRLYTTVSHIRIFMDICTCDYTPLYTISALWTSVLAPVQHSTPYLHYGHLYLRLYTTLPHYGHSKKHSLYVDMYYETLPQTIQSLLIYPLHKHSSIFVCILYIGQIYV